MHFLRHLNNNYYSYTYIQIITVVFLLIFLQEPCSTASVKSCCEATKCYNLCSQNNLIHDVFHLLKYRLYHYT